jgi:O-methyltransferase
MKIRKIVGNFLRKYPRLFKVLAAAYRLVRAALRLVRLNYLGIKDFSSNQFNIIDRTEASYMGDGFATRHHVAFLHDKNFCDAYRSGFDNIDYPGVLWQRDSLNIAWRAHIVTWAANQALKINGDFVECGVWYGVLSKTICEYTNFPQSDKKFYLIDMWGDPMSDRLHENYKTDMFSVVKERFKAYPNVQLIRGSVPEILDEVPVTKIAYLSIDMNGYVAERKTLERYYDRVVPGGIIYFDDYGWDYPKLRETVDDFFRDKPEKLLHFPSGNSIVVKL